MRWAVWGVFVGFWFLGFHWLFTASAADKDTDRAIKTPVQNVGGLYFDYDEGVKIEKGPGGSVYVQSNREYMQKKFRTFDDRFHALEDRLDTLEGLHAEELGAKEEIDAARTPERERKVLTS